jgi:hypothetical protein
MRLYIASFIALAFAQTNKALMLAGYQPVSNISIISTIDLDAAALVANLGVGNYVEAAKAYNEGSSVPGLTLASMSTTAQAIMGDCGTRCPYSTFKKFLTYYGEPDYGHRIVQSAFDMTSTQGLLRLNNDFSNITNAARAGQSQLSSWVIFSFS